MISKRILTIAVLAALAVPPTVVMTGCRRPSTRPQNVLIVLVDTLRKDHDRILGSLRALLTSCMTYAEGKQPENPQLRRWTAQVMEQLSEHEQQETEMMQRAYTEDIGAGD